MLAGAVMTNEGVRRHWGLAFVSAAEFASIVDTMVQMLLFQRCPFST